MDSPAIRTMWMRLLGTDAQCHMADERVLRNTVLLTATLERKLQHAVPETDAVRSWSRMTKATQRTILADCVSVLSIPVATKFAEAVRMLKMGLTSPGTSKSLVQYTYTSLCSLRDVSPYQAVRNAIIGIQLTARVKGPHCAVIVAVDDQRARRKAGTAMRAPSHTAKILRHRAVARDAGFPELLHELAPYYTVLPTHHGTAKAPGHDTLRR